MNFTIEDKEPLKKAYDNAIEKNDTTFEYKGNVILVAYCKYVLELMDMSS